MTHQTTQAASQIQAGDILDMAVGPTLVLEVSGKRSGIECRVHRSGDSPWLWFWPAQPVTVLGRNPARAHRLCEARAAKGAALRERLGAKNAP